MRCGESVGKFSSSFFTGNPVRPLVYNGEKSVLVIYPYITENRDGMSCVCCTRPQGSRDTIVEMFFGGLLLVYGLRPLKTKYRCLFVAVSLVLVFVMDTMNNCFDWAIVSGAQIAVLSSSSQLLYESHFQVYYTLNFGAKERCREPIELMSDFSSHQNTRYRAREALAVDRDVEEKQEDKLFTRCSNMHLKSDFQLSKRHVTAARRQVKR